MKARDRTRRFFKNQLGGVFSGKARKVPRWVWRAEPLYQPTQ